MREVLKACYPIHEIYEEYPYDMILKIGYKKLETPELNHNKFLLIRAKKLRADFCIPKLSLIIEVQGEHHYKAINYNDDIDEAESSLETRKHLDKIKRLIASEAEFLMIEWPYYDSISESLFLDRINKTNEFLNRS